MTVVKMEFVSTIGILKELDSFVNVCVSSNFFQADDVFSIYSYYEKIKKFSPIKDNDEILVILDSLNEIFNKIKKKPNEVIVKKIEKVDIDKIKKYVDFFCKKISSFYEKNDNLDEEIKEISRKISILKKISYIENSFEAIYDCKYVMMIFGKVLIKNFHLKEGDDFVIFEIVKEKEYIYIFAFFIKEHSEKLFEHLEKIKFEESLVPSFDNSVSDEIFNLENRIKEIREEQSQNIKKIDVFWNENVDYISAVFKKLLRISKFSEIKAKAAQFKDEFIVVGWIPEYEANNFVKKINSMSGLECVAKSAEKFIKFKPPTKLKNPSVFSPFEIFVEMYGMPRYNEFDPTVFVAITYTLIFGIMFADAGQGFVIFLISLYLKKQNKENKFGGILRLCGISSTFFGFIFGTAFGFEEVFNPLYKNVFKLSHKPIDAMEPSMIMKILYASICLGMILIIFAIIINIILTFKKRKIATTFFSQNGVAGLALYIGLLLLIIDSFVNIGLFSPVLFLCLIVIPTILIYLKEILISNIDHNIKFSPKSWFEFLLLNLFEVFEIILNYFTNTLSFVRIGAFIFVHIGLMSTVFNLAKMTGFFYIPTIIIGNIIITAFEALIVGIQVMRLEYCELFGRFFSGSGRKFEPSHDICNSEKDNKK